MMREREGKRNDECELTFCINVMMRMIQDEKIEGAIVFSYEYKLLSIYTLLIEKREKNFKNNLTTLFKNTKINS